MTEKNLGLWVTRVDTSEGQGKTDIRNILLLRNRPTLQVFFSLLQLHFEWEVNIMATFWRILVI